MEKLPRVPSDRLQETNETESRKRLNTAVWKRKLKFEAERGNVAHFSFYLPGESVIFRSLDVGFSFFLYASIATGFEVAGAFLR